MATALRPKLNAFLRALKPSYRFMRFVRIAVPGRKTAITTSADMAAIPHADDSSNPYKAGMNGTSASIAVPRLVISMFVRRPASTCRSGLTCSPYAVPMPAKPANATAKSATCSSSSDSLSMDMMPSPLPVNEQSRRAAYRMIAGKGIGFVLLECGLTCRMYARPTTLNLRLRLRRGHHHISHEFT